MAEYLWLQVGNINEFMLNDDPIGIKKHIALSKEIFFTNSCFILLVFEASES